MPIPRFAKSAFGLSMVYSICVSSGIAVAEPPTVSYIFPAGGQRGTTVNVRIGGHFLYESPSFEMGGHGIAYPQTLKPIERIWFEGPIIPQPPSQRQEDYPRDYGTKLQIAADAPLGIRRWRTSTSQGITPSLKFVVGQLPEVVEEEIDGDPIPTKVTLPVTINGRTFPREDVDIWTFDAKAGDVVTCEVNAARIGSPVDSHLTVVGPRGETIAENIDYFGTDSFLRFTAKETGTYAVHIHDMEYGGLQHHVYRLTISAGPWVDFVYPIGGKRGTTIPFELHGANLPANQATLSLPNVESDFYSWQPEIPGLSSSPLLLGLSSYEELLEAEPNNENANAIPFAVPAVLNGRIGGGNDIDVWKFEAKKDEQFEFEVFAARLGSALDSVLLVFDEQGKQLARSDDLASGEADSKTQFQAPADGTYFVHVTDRVESRGGDRFAYRLRATHSDASGPDFRIVLRDDALTVAPGGQLQVQVEADRGANFQDEIELYFENVPEGITLKGNKIGKGRPNTRLTIVADETVKPQTLKVSLLGKAILKPAADKKGKNKKGEPKEDDPKPIEIIRKAIVKTAPGEPSIDEVTLAIAVPTPFKFFAPFETKYAPRGSVYVRRYHIDRGGYEGPIEISVADRQNRHLQGVTGPKIIVPPGETEFDYPVTLPPWMEIGRTSRTCLAATADVEDADGKKHTVSYSSQTQDDQIIVLVDPVRLTVSIQEGTIRATPGNAKKVTVKIGRDNELSGDVTVDLQVPSHIHGVTAKAITIPSGEEFGELAIEFGGGDMGPFNAPLIVRAQMLDERGHPLTAETKLEVVE